MPLNTLNLGKFLSGELALYDKQFVDIIDDDLWGARGENIPSRGDLPFGVEEVNSYRREFIGEAAVYDGRSYDIPLVDQTVAGMKSKAVLVVAGAEWSVSDINRTQLQSQVQILPQYSLTEAKMEAVNTSINRRIHKLTLAGMPSIGMYGMFNSNRVSVGDQTAVKPFTLTPTALYNWVKGLVAAFKKTSRLAYANIDLFVDDDLYAALCTPLGDNTGDNPYMRLTSAERGQFVGSIEPLSELEPATLVSLGVVGAGVGRMIMGNFGSERSVIRHFHNIDRSQEFLKDSGFHFGVTAWAATSEVIYKIPEQFQYVNYNPSLT